MEQDHTFFIILKGIWNPNISQIYPKLEQDPKHVMMVTKTRATFWKFVTFLTKLEQQAI